MMYIHILIWAFITLGRFLILQRRFLGCFRQKEKLGKNVDIIIQIPIVLFL